jgi:hypothetical protein
MEITFLKDHLDHTAGDSVTVTSDQGNYLIRCNVAEETDGKNTAPLKTPYVRPSRAKIVPDKTKASKIDDEFDL